MPSSENTHAHSPSKNRTAWLRWRRRIIIAGLVVTVGGFGSVWISHWWIERNSRGRVFRNIESVPIRKVGLVLGTSKQLGDGRENLYFKYRTQAAADLYKAGKVSHLLVSGDNGSRGYDEPTDMMERLVKLGVPESDITCDYAGFRTLDSIVRAKEVFDLNSFTVISDAFHVDRALFLADRKGVVDAIGYASKEVGGMSGKRVKARELLARTKAVADIYLLFTKPKFLGDKEPIL